MKRLSSLLCIAVLALLLIVLPTDATAAVGGAWGDICYEYSDGVLRISGTGEMPSWGAPNYAPWHDFADEVDTVYVEEGITSLGEGAFYRFTELQIVYLPNTLETIGKYAFCGCSRLHSVVDGDLDFSLPDSVRRIEESAFFGSGFDALDLGDGVEYIGNQAFGGCFKLYRCILSPALTHIGEAAFEATAMPFITLPEQVAYIGQKAFYNCYELEEIRFLGGAPTMGQKVFATDAGVITATAYYPANNATWTASKRQNYGGQLTWESVAADYKAMGPCGDYVSWFLDRQGYLVIYGYGPMEGWDSPAHAPWLEYAEEIYTVYVDDGVTSISEGAFHGLSALTTVRLPDTLETIGDSAFFACPELYWVLNSDLEQSIPDSVKRIEDGAFLDCYSLTNLDLGNGVTYLGDFAFGGCIGLNQLTLSPALTQIDNYAFYFCYNLTSVTIPAKVTSIGDYAFLDCRGLKDIRFTGNAPSFGTDVFGSDYGVVKPTAYYSAGNSTWTASKRQNYGGQLTWKSVASDYVALGTCGDNASWTLDKNGKLTIFGTGAMYDYNTIHYPPWYNLQSQIKAVVVEEGITEVGNTAFYKCYSIASLSLPQSLTRLGNDSIFDCDQLQTLYIGPNVSDVGQSNFINCDMLAQYIVDPANRYFCNDSAGALYNKDKTLLISVPGAFRGHYTIPYGVVEIHDFAFDCYKGLTGVTIPNTVKIIGNSAFSCCYGLESLVIPASVERIAHAAFWCCDGLQEIRFLGNAPIFEEDAIFVNVTATVTYPANDPTWTQDKFVHPNSELTWVAVTYEKPAFSVPGLGEFATLSEAVAAYDPATQYIKLLRDVEVDTVISKDLKLDLCGFSICGLIDTQGHDVYGMDTTTDSYDCEGMGYFDCLNEYARPLVPVSAWRTEATGAVRRYMTIYTIEGYTFHRFWLGITYMNLKPTKDAFGYRANFYGDRMVRSEVTQVGYRIWMNGGQSVSRYMNNFRDELTLRLSGINVTRHGETPVNACVFLTMADGTVVESGTVSRSMRNMLEAANDSWLCYSRAQQFALQDLANRYPVIKTWDTENLWT